VAVFDFAQSAHEVVRRHWSIAMHAPQHPPERTVIVSPAGHDGGTDLHVACFWLHSASVTHWPATQIAAVTPSGSQAFVAQVVSPHVGGVPLMPRQPQQSF
jgi:hypothetical protein